MSQHFCRSLYIVDLFAALHELASASARTLLKLASSVRALLKPYGDTLNVIQNTEGNKSFIRHKQFNYDINAILQIWVNPAELGTNQSRTSCLSCYWKELVFLCVLRWKAQLVFYIPCDT